ncbi:unknown [Hungatella hathewayi CAG:224]|nr:unknown [Hungatella hathewayi CAG:224]
MDLWRTIQLGKETYQHGVTECPWLIFIIADIFYFQADFFHNLAADSLFQSLTEFCVAGYQSIAGVFTACIFGEKKLISIGDSHYDGWCDLWVDSVAAGRADHGAFLFTFYVRCAAAAAKMVIAVEAVKLCTVGSCK